MALTSHDLLSSLRYYDIAGVERGDGDDEDVLVLGRVLDQPRQLSARFPGYESQPRDIDSRENTEQRLSKWIHDQIRRCDLDGVVSADLMHLFFDRVRLTDVAVPTRLRVGEYRIEQVV